MDYEEIPSEKELRKTGRILLTSNNPEKEIKKQLQKLDKKTTELSITNGYMTIKGNKQGNVEIICHGQKVLTISETSDRDVINLFFYPEGKRKYKTQIIKSLSSEERKNASCTHELLSSRGKESKKLWDKNEPVMHITGKGKKKLKESKNSNQRRSLIQLFDRISHFS